MVLEVSPHSSRSIDRPIWVNIGAIVLLAMMGLRLPSGRLLVKILYTIAEIVPIVIVGALGMRSVGLLYIIVAIRSYLIFGRQYRLWITGGIFILALLASNLRPERRKPVSGIDRPPSLTQRKYPDRDEFRWGFVVMFGGILLSLQLLLDRMLAEKQAKEELAIANQRIRNYAFKAEELATLQERNRIAREIHDSLGHSLTTLNLYLEMSIKLAHIHPERSHEVLAEAKRLGSIALQDVRQSVSALRSAPLQGQNLPQAIHKLVDEFDRANQMSCRCELDLPPQISPEIATAIYRIVQEGLTNISKYANASAASIEITTTQASICLRIVDNGGGFDPAHNATGFGLQGMQERVRALQGKFTIVSAPQQGCQIEATIPLDRDWQGNI